MSITYRRNTNAIHLERADDNDPNVQVVVSVPVPALKAIFSELPNPITRIKIIRAFNDCSLIDAKDIHDFWALVVDVARTI